MLPSNMYLFLIQSQTWLNWMERLSSNVFTNNGIYPISLFGIIFPIFHVFPILIVFAVFIYHFVETHHLKYVIGKQEGSLIT